MPIQPKQQPPYYTNSNSIKLFKATITQTATNNPTATILTNETGEIPTFSRTDIGTYAIQFIQDLPQANKLIMLITANGELASIVRSTDNIIEFWTTADDLFDNNTLIIEFHP